MSTITVATLVAAPVESVFAVYTDLAKSVERIPELTALELLTEGPVGKGTRWRETRVMFKKKAVEEMWISSFDPPRSYTAEAKSHGMRYETLFEFVAKDGGTRVTWTFDGTPLTLGARIMAPIFGILMGGVMKKCMRNDLEALAAVCERGAAAAR
ncbi:MAG: SRPBCC family protein [Nannocystaceae bacterium]